MRIKALVLAALLAVIAFTATGGIKPPPNVPPSVTLLSPNGGEVWKGKESHFIMWTYTSGTAMLTSVDLEWSATPAIDPPVWKPIATALSPTSSPYTWVIPNETGSETCLVRVTLHYTMLGGRDAFVQDESDAYFTVFMVPEVRWWRELQ